MTNQRESPTLDELVLIMEYHPKPETRNKAGEKAIDNYVQKRWYDGLVNMSKNKNISEELRNKAGENIELVGKKVIDKYVQNEQYGNLAKMSKNEDISEELRNKAKKRN